MSLVDSFLDTADLVLDRADSLLDAAASAGANAFDMTLGSGVADLRPLPRSIIDEQPQRTVFRYVTSKDAGGEAVHAVGWCLGGIMSALAVASHRELPVRSLVLIASPFDFERVRLAAPIRRLAGLTGGAFVTTLYRALGGAPTPFVSLGFRLTAIDRYLTKPVFVLRNLHDRETLAQTEAVDNYMANMLAYPGRTFGQLYHTFFRVNDLADGHIDLGGRSIDLAHVSQPVLSIAGTSDLLAPVDAVEAVVDEFLREQEVGWAMTLAQAAR